MAATSSDLTALRKALLDLPSSGPKGFEGLLATIFSKLLGVPFRLAKSGSQFGVDGKTSDPAYPVAFEAKRYRDEIPSSEVLNKIGALAIRDDPVELWILGTTGIVASQVADDLDALANIHGFTTLILDWQPSAPRLGAVLAEACVEAGEFLSRNVPTKGLASKAIIELQNLSRREGIAEISSSILCQLRTASIATPLARDANRRWLIETLSNRIKAKSRLGQALTPLEEDATPVLARSHLLNELRANVEGAPMDRLVAVLGDEGNGKSWLAIRACVNLSASPLVVVFSPEEFVTIPEGVNWDLILANKILTQTQESFSAKSETRWLRRFEYWRNVNASSTPRLLVLIDGLNQRSTVSWGRHIDSLVLHTYELGGCTMVTSRTEYFKRHVEPRLCSTIKSLVVPQWTEQERDEILASKGVAGTKLLPAVANSLLNPRLLGIALTLLDADTLENLEALNVTWLLFEHLRMLDRERSDNHSAGEFAKMLQDHAKNIIARVRTKTADDLTVFENLEPAAEGRFFQWLEGEPNRYTLRDHGITYALGLAVIEELRAAVRNHKDVTEALQAVLEPIAALDQTAAAILAAITIACLDEQISKHIGVTLLAGFAQLQNPEGGSAASLTELARRRVQVFCEACEVLWMSPTPAPNADWLENALHAIKNRPEVWRDMLPFLEKWLRYWWPDILIDYKAQHTQGSAVDARRDAEAERDQRMNSLNEVEREYLSQLIDQQASPYRLIGLTIRLCAGMPLENLTSSIACASFSMALTPSPFSPDDALSNLILFNRCDWSNVRSKLIVHAERLTSLGTSESGRWAAIALLRATGAFDDSAAAHKFYLELTKDREQYTSWRLVESYCATDPCDPDSDRPANFHDTAEKYAQLDVSKFKIVMGMTEQDHFVKLALPGLARFAPDIAVRKHREFLRSLPGRRGLPLRQATWAALNDTALIDDELATHFLTLSTSLNSENADIDEASIAHVQQALLQAAFPHLSPQEQFSGINALPNPHHIWLNLLQLVNDGSPSQLLDIARQYSSSDLRMAVPLIMASRMNKESIPSFVSMLPELLSSPHSLVRSAAFRLAAHMGDPEVLEAIVASDWTSGSASHSTREPITGSLALIEAARKGVISTHEILQRISPETFGIACACLDDACIERLAAMLDACVRAASGFVAPLPPVEIVLAIARTNEQINARLSLEEVSKASPSVRDTLRGLSENLSEFDARQKKLHDAYEIFENQLTPQMATVVLGSFRVDAIRAILRVTPGLVQDWVKLLCETSEPRRRSLRNFGFYVACALTYSEIPSKGIELLTLLQEGTSFVRVRYTLAGLPLESVALWWSADDEDVIRLRFARLDGCENDQELALEAATAIFANKAAILKAYVRDRLSSQLPVDVARAITVAGFSNDTILASEVATNFNGDAGLLAKAAKSSRYAMERYKWSKHWFDKMLAASTEENFWAASVLFLKVVDARFEAEYRDELVGTKVFNTWWWSVERRLKQRFDSWANKRKNTLFGSKVPDSIYLPQAQYPELRAFEN